MCTRTHKVHTQIIEGPIHQQQTLRDKEESSSRSNNSDAHYQIESSIPVHF